MIWACSRGGGLAVLGSVLKRYSCRLTAPSPSGSATGPLIASLSSSAAVKLVLRQRSNGRSTTSIVARLELVKTPSVAVSSMMYRPYCGNVTTAEASPLLLKMAEAGPLTWAHEAV